MDFNANFNVEKSIKFKQECLESLVQMMLITKGKLKITESEMVNKCEILMDKDERITLDVDEQIFLREYIKQKQITDEFRKQLMSKYHIAL